MGKFGKVALLAVLLTLGLVATALARPVFLTGGGVVEAQSVWQENGKVYVLVNHESLVTFYAHEVDLKKTFDPKWSKPSKKAPAKAAKAAPPAAVAAPSAIVVPPPPPAAMPEQPSSAVPAVAAKPAPEAAKPSPPPPAVAVKPVPQPRPAIAPRPVAAPVAPEPDLVAVLLAALPLVLGSLALVLVLIASIWKVFAKAGQAGWKSLIPIYNLVVWVQIAGRPGWWVLLLFVPVVNLAISVLVQIDLAKRFGKGLAFGLGLTFFGFIFYPLLAFGKATYEGGAQGWTDLPEEGFDDEKPAF